VAMQQRSILRKYRSMGPGKFHVFNQRVRNGLTNNTSVPESTWAGNPTLVSSYLSLSEKHDAAFHEASYGSKLAMAQRDALQAQLIICLDEIASLLEAAAVRNPDLLLCTGFELGKERRGRSRQNLDPTVSEDFHGANAEHPVSE
jgi:hypothetical protein